MAASGLALRVALALSAPVQVSQKQITQYWVKLDSNIHGNDRFLDATLVNHPLGKIFRTEPQRGQRGKVNYHPSGNQCGQAQDARPA